MRQKRYEVMVDGMFYAGVNAEGVIAYRLDNGRQYASRDEAEKMADHVGGTVVRIGDWKRDYR